MKAQTLVPLAAAAAAQLLVVGNIAAAFAFQQKPPVETLVTVPVVAEIEQVECIRQDPVPYEPVTYQVPLDAELQSYTEKMCDLYDVPLELAYAVMQVESGFTPAAHSSTGDYGLMQINSINAGWLKDKLGITDLLDVLICPGLATANQFRNLCTTDEIRLFAHDCRPPFEKRILFIATFRSLAKHMISSHSACSLSAIWPSAAISTIASRFAQKR